MSAISLTGCCTNQPLVTDSLGVTTSARYYNQDSVYIRDSVLTHIRSDTVFIERWHVKNKYIKALQTDTVTRFQTRYETQKVRYVPKIYRLSLLIVIIIAAYLILRLYWRLSHL